MRVAGPKELSIFLVFHPTRGYLVKFVGYVLIVDFGVQFDLNDAALSCVHVCCHSQYLMLHGDDSNQLVGEPSP